MQLFKRLSRWLENNAKEKSATRQKLYKYPNRVRGKLHKLQSQKCVKNASILMMLSVLLLCRHPYCLHTKPQGATATLSFQQNLSSKSFLQAIKYCYTTNLVIIAVVGGSTALYTLMWVGRILCIWCFRAFVARTRYADGHGSVLVKERPCRLQTSTSACHNHVRNITGSRPWWSPWASAL
jgi:hypothetical protein